MLFFCLYYLVLKICESDSLLNEKRVSDYFNSDTFNSFQNQWQKERKSYENALKLSLKDSYGYKGMNVYVRKSADSQRIANGFYVYDNVVGVIGQHMFIGELPHFTSLEVTFALASNVLRMETGLSRIFLYTQYILLRNHSDIVFGGENSSNFSPFAFEEVQHAGPLAIIAEDCTLSGYAIMKLNGQSVDVGHNTFKVTDCKFSVEISATGMGIAPITAPYFNHQQSVVVEKLISKPIRDELLPKLQASLLTYVNTSNTFGDSLRSNRLHQARLFKDTSKDLLNKIRALNKNTVRTNQGVTELKSFSITWNVCAEIPCDSRVYLNDIFLYGLDNMYSPYSGGPYKLQSTKVGESIRFHYLQVRGKVGFKNGTRNNEHDFFAEIHDASVNIEIDLDKQTNTVDFVDWRAIELSISDFKEAIYERIRANSLIIGHLLYEVPNALKEHTLNLFEGKSAPNKMSLDRSDEKSDDANNVPNDSPSLEKPVSVEDKSIDDGFQTKAFNKRGEISNGGVYKSPKADTYAKKKIFDKGGEVNGQNKLEADSASDSGPSPRSSSQEHQHPGSDSKKSLVLSGQNPKDIVQSYNYVKKKKFDKGGEVNVKKELEAGTASDSIPSQRSSSQEHEDPDSENNPSLLSKQNPEGIMPSFNTHVKKKKFDKAGEVNVKKEVEAGTASDLIPSAKSSSQEHQYPDSDNDPSVQNKQNPKGIMQTYNKQNVASDLTSSSIEERGQSKIDVSSS